MKTRYYLFILFSALFLVACDNENKQKEEPFYVDTTPIEMYVGEKVKIKTTGAIEYDTRSNYESIDITEEGVLTAKLPGYAEVIVRDKNNYDNTAVVPLKIFGKHPLISSIVDYDLITYWKECSSDERNRDVEVIKGILNSNQISGWEYRKGNDGLDKFYHVGIVDSLAVSVELNFWIHSYEGMDKASEFLTEQTGGNKGPGPARYKSHIIAIIKHQIENGLWLEFAMDPR